jgi:hypothetical protein
MDVKKLKSQFSLGSVHADPLLEIIAQQAEQIEQQAEQIEQQAEQIEQLKKKIDSKNPTQRLGESYSEKADVARKARKKRKKKRCNSARCGRTSTADKIKLAQRTEKIFPEGVSHKQCKLSHTRVAWRLEQGRAVLVAYEIYRCRNQFGKPAGLLGRSEYGIEIIVAIAYQVYCLGLSIDKACEVLSFFQQLKLSKSQADRLLNQLARVWEIEFDTLCTLLANSAVVQCDETSWSINSVWAFLNEKLTVLFYGVHKDGETLKSILDKETFFGTLISDNAAIYQNFDNAQKCWAHLLRKAIKLTVQSPDESRYQTFTDRLLEIYRKAKRITVDKRFSTAGREQKVKELNQAIRNLCRTRYQDKSTSDDEVEEDFRRLANEIMRLMLVDELFTFVTTEGVDGNNNASERQLRDDAMARKTGRTSKTPQGAKRRSIISSVLQSIGKQLESFTLERVILEIKAWMHRGRSNFREQVDELGLTDPGRDQTLLDELILNADPA